MSPKNLNVLFVAELFDVELFAAMFFMLVDFVLDIVDFRSIDEAFDGS